MSLKLSLPSAHSCCIARGYLLWSGMSCLLTTFTCPSFAFSLSHQALINMEKSRRDRGDRSGPTRGQARPMLSTSHVDDDEENIGTRKKVRVIITTTMMIIMKGIKRRRWAPFALEIRRICSFLRLCYSFLTGHSLLQAPPHLVFRSTSHR